MKLVKTSTGVPLIGHCLLEGQIPIAITQVGKKSTREMGHATNAKIYFLLDNSC
jgi:hypothetical protein